ncbi:DUF3613 domain-containing protein [Halomonas sp. NCCP-2165]|nr:DUF3613 domain-containing protein [Halomonas sp. NCCP-2165]GKW50331.1 hypothetical protein NCCP2165_25460 [Halomonas sp. NCCP-2165]
MNGFTKVAASCLLVLGMSLSGSALAQGVTASSRAGTTTYHRETAPRVTAGSHSVRELLALQRHGQAASPHRQHVSGEVQARIYRRYLESFGHPIPERYIDTDFSGE